MFKEDNLRQEKNGRKNTDRVEKMEENRDKQRRTEQRRTEKRRTEIGEEKKAEGGSKKRRLQFRMEEQDAGRTIGAYLTRTQGFTKMQVKRMKYQPGGILVDGVQARVTHVLLTGELLDISIETGKQRYAAETREREPSESKEAENEKRKIQKNGRLTWKEILYEDSDVIAVWKAHGIPLHPAHGHHGDTLMDMLQETLAKRDGCEKRAVQLYSIGRLDLDTSGIVVFARNQVAAQRLWKQREDGRFKKQYLARCEGHFPEEAKEEQCISLPIAPVSGELNRMQADREGKRAVTYYQIWREMEKETWLLLHLDTGRTHQIRVHMAWLGHPLVGDSLYGNGTAGKTYAALSAAAAVFFQPFTGERIVLNYLDKAQRGE